MRSTIVVAMSVMLAFPTASGFATPDAGPVVSRRADSRATLTRTTPPGPRGGVPAELSGVRSAGEAAASPTGTAAPAGTTGGGETFALATVIPSLPYTDSGSTSGAVNDYNPPCASAGAPDVVYRYTPAVTTCVTIGLCGSTYDTALHLYQDSPAGLVACNDDHCGNPPMASKLRSVPLEAGHDYYIVVDGWGCDALGCSQGSYTLSVTTDCPAPCAVTCPPGAVLEGETTLCDASGTNGGCDLAVPVFTDITVGTAPLTVCGTYGSLPDASVRDTDWYRFVLSERSRVDFCVTGEATQWLSIVDLNLGCPAGTVTTVPTEPCVEGCLSATLPAGTYAFVVASIFAVDVPCGRTYVFTASATPAPCMAECPPGALQEGETTVCDINGTNDGCNMAVPAYTDLEASAAGVTVCGTYGSSPDGSMRDTDWYRVVLTQRTHVDLCFTGELDGFVAIVDLAPGCAGPVIVNSMFPIACHPACVDATLNPGTYVLFAASNYGARYPCGSRYQLTATCTPMTLAELHCNGTTGLPLMTGQTIVAEGVVTSNFPTAASARFTLQDSGGGIAVFGTGTYCGALGDRVRVQGNVTQFLGLCELGAPLTFSVVSSGNPQPEPRVVTPAQVNATYQPGDCEPNESRLVRLEKVRIVNTSGTELPPGAVFAAQTSYGIQAEDLSLATLRIVQTTPNNCTALNPLVGTTIPIGFVNIVGVVSQSDATSPYTSGYQVWPRVPEDITLWSSADVPPAGSSALSLSQARPNPSRGSVGFRLVLPSAVLVHAAVFDIAGRCVAVLASRSFAAGEHSLDWDGRTLSGEPAGPGVYRLRLVAGEATLSRSIIVVH